MHLLNNNVTIVNQPALVYNNHARYLFVKQLTRHIPDSESLNIFIAEYKQNKKEITLQVHNKIVEVLRVRRVVFVTYD